MNHGDGKETALFDDDRSVTFHREKDGSLVWDAGLASLLPSIAAGYYIFHGFNPPTARMDGRTMTYRVAAPLKPYEEPYVYTATGSKCVLLWGDVLIKTMRSEEVRSLFYRSKVRALVVLVHALVARDGRRYYAILY